MRLKLIQFCEHSFYNVLKYYYYYTKSTKIYYSFNDVVFLTIYFVYNQIDNSRQN